MNIRLLDKVPDRDWLEEFIKPDKCEMCGHSYDFHYVEGVIFGYFKALYHAELLNAQELASLHNYYITWAVHYEQQFLKEV